MTRKQYLETVLEKSFKELKIIENYEKIRGTKGKDLKIIELCIKSIDEYLK